MYDKIFSHYKGNLKSKTIAVWGLSFKPQTDDMREAPSLEIINKLITAGAHVKAYDPVALDEAKHHFGDKITYCSDQYETLIDADCMAVLTEWSEFRVPNLKIVKRLLNNAIIFDGRNIYDKEEMEALDFTYYCIGVKTNNRARLKNLQLAV